MADWVHQFSQRHPRLWMALIVAWCLLVAAALVGTLVGVFIEPGRWT